MKSQYRLILPLLLGFMALMAMLSFATPPAASDFNLKYKRDTLLVASPLNLKGGVLKLRKKSILVVCENGSISNGTIVGKRSQLVVKGTRPAIATNVTLSGLWRNKVVLDRWFDFDNTGHFNANRLLENMLALTNDDDTCHIILDADRCYFVEMPYKGEANLGDMISYTLDEKGQKKRNWEDLSKDEFAFSRIFTIPSNTHLTIQNRIELRGTNQGSYYLFWEYQKENITIDGHGSVSGDARTHLYTSPFMKGGSYYGEWGHVFSCIACRNFTFRDITIENAFGDCVYYEPDYWTRFMKDRCSHNLTMEGVRIRYARRNGLAVGSKGAIIRGCTFEGCGSDQVKGTAPRAAVDFEPDGMKRYPEIGNENVVMENCTFVGNKHDVSSTHNNTREYGRVATTIRNCRFTAPVRFNATNWIAFENCQIPDFTNHKGAVSSDEPIRHVTFKDCTIQRLPALIKAKDWGNSFTGTTTIKTSY